MEISADLRNKLVEEAITICDEIEEQCGIPMTLAEQAAMTRRLIAVAEMVLNDAAAKVDAMDDVDRVQT